MKILVAYDGSECADAAVADMSRAGLPADAEAVVLSVAQPTEVPSGAMATGPGAFVPQSMADVEPYEVHLEKAQGYADSAAARLREAFPRWRIATEALVDAAQGAIVRKAGDWNADLIVVGSRGQSHMRGLLLGSVSQYVIHHAPCSVRIGRRCDDSRKRPIRILIGVDGSENAKAAVRAVCARNWPAGTEARMAGVLDSRIAIAAATTLEGTVPVAIEEESRRRMTAAVQEAVHELGKAELNATAQVPIGVPAEALAANAEKWTADCLFVGARGLNALQRVLLGSVSSGVAIIAGCSVEIVR
jgi:nucleotide-binding universal stress UspA family protein